MSSGVLIVGAGHAAGALAAALRQNGYADPITLVGAEPLPPYQRPPLSKAWLKGEIEADALLLRAVARRQPAMAPVVTATGWVAILGLASNAGIALFHAGVEQKWWQGLTRCTAPPVAGDAKSMMADILAQPLVRCDAIPWQMFGISMAGWNFIVSLMLVGAATWLMLKPR